MIKLSLKRGVIAAATAFAVATTGPVAAVSAAPSDASSKQSFNRDLGSIDSNSSMPGTNKGSSATGWFDRQQGWVQKLLIAFGVLQIVALVIGPARLILFNLFKI
ncbi:MAG: hypothetical protein Q4A31_07335 [Corynebacterium sp.]|uniref:hypothetical protein n=1 Tax=Corynebacterium sp. TaxID=1720 RepID=UPI0026DBF89B|nr:hypothetical protein [Corynebacterium sp.]MDO4761714.1 hypothetical protein [Corynebacterium sp.]